MMLTAAVWFSLIPVVGNPYGFSLFLIGTVMCGRYLGFGPTLFALVTYHRSRVSGCAILTRRASEGFFGSTELSLESLACASGSCIESSSLRRRESIE